MNRTITALLLLTIFVTGFCALTYQVVWLRSIYLVFGVHAYSTSAVLTAFMAGLAIGSYSFGMLSDRVKNPMVIYFFIEAGLFVYAITFQSLFDLTRELYVNFFSGPGTDFSQKFIKFAESFLLLIVPTTLMGGTIPVVTKILVNNLQKLGRELSLIYALNNFGAALGGFTAGFFLIRLLGMKETLYLAASLNLMNAVIIFMLRKRGNDNHVKSVSKSYENETDKRWPAGYVRLILFIFALEGFTTLAYEVLWTRIFIEFSYDKTVYIYSVIVVGFIFGLSLGSIIIRRWINKFRDLPAVLGYIQLGIAAISFFLLIFFVYLSPLLVQDRGTGSNWLAVSGKEYLIMFLIITLPVTLMGATFPIVGKITSGNLKELGSKIGVIGFLDTVGSIFGSFVAGFIMIPVFGIYQAFIITVLLNIILGILLFYFHPFPGNKRKIALTATVILAIAIIFSPGYSEYFKQRVRYYPGEEVISYAEGVSATVSVHKLPSGHKALAINGAKTAFSTSSDLKVHTMLAYAPYFLTKDEGSAFIIGFGMGVTASCLAQTDIPVIDVAELSPEVVNTSSVHFNYLNQDVINNPKVNIFYEDGRSFLLRQHKKYGLITSNAVHARLGANLYTREFYEICLDKLSEDGYMCQWLPTNWLSDQEFKSLVKSFTEVFPNSGLWYVTRGHLLLMGSRMKRDIDPGELKRKFKKPAVLRNFYEVDITSPAHFLGYFIAGSRALNQLTMGTDINTDNFPRVEFSMITDLSPNYKILEEISELDYNFPQIFNIEQGSADHEFFDRVKGINNQLRQEIRFSIRDSQ